MKNEKVARQYCSLWAYVCLLGAVLHLVQGVFLGFSAEAFLHLQLMFVDGALFFVVVGVRKFGTTELLKWTVKYLTAIAFCLAVTHGFSLAMHEYQPVELLGIGVDVVLFLLGVVASYKGSEEKDFGL